MSARPLLAILLLTCLACAAPTRRAEYAPVGQDVDDSLALWSDEDSLSAFAVRCQGRYFNEVDGQHVATVHLQLLATRTDSSPMTLPLADLTLTLQPSGAVLRPGEVWSGQQRSEARLDVPAWSRVVADLFFDQPSSDADDEPPELLRLRFVHVAGEGRREHHECQFFLLDEDDPRQGAEHTVDDISFGYRDGHYFPGLAELGPRRLVPTEESRLFYVFHSP